MTRSTTRALARQWSSRIIITAATLALAACSPGGTEAEFATAETESTTNSDTPVQHKATSDWSVVTTSDNGDGYVRFGDGTWQWLNQACVSQLETNGVSVSRVEWNTVSSLTQISGAATCEEVADAMEGANAGGNGNWSVVTTNDNGDGYVRFGDDTWQWLDSACISRLRSDGISIEQVQWNTVSHLQQVSGQTTCDEVAGNGAGGETGGGGGGGSNNSTGWSVVTTNDNGDGYVRFGDDTWQWLSSTCVSSLQTSGIDVTRVQWSDVSDLTQVYGQATCEEITTKLSDSAGGGGQTNENWSVVTTNTNGDGYVRFTDDTRQWLSAACVSSVRNAGIAVTTVQWSDIQGLTQVNGVASCDQVISTINDGSAGGNSGGNNQTGWSLVSTDTSGSGYVRFGDGTWQWLSASCMNSLSDAGLSVTSVQWAEVSNLTQVTGQVSCEEVLAELGDSSNTQSFNVTEFFKQFTEQGATYSLTGSFDNGGIQSEQRHEIDRSPAIDTPAQWRGRGDLKLNVITVDRFVNGDAGVSDTYNVYSDSALKNFGDETVADNSVRVNFGGSNAPDTVQMGTFGTGDTIYMFDSQAGAVFTGTRKNSWRMTKNNAGESVYCDKSDEYDASDNYVWSFESCYGIDAGTGNPSGYISYSYTSGSNSGFIDGENLRLGGTPTKPEAVSLPTLAVQAATIDFTSAQNGIAITYGATSDQIRLTVTWPDGFVKSFTQAAANSPLTIKIGDHPITAGAYNVDAVAINNVGRESDVVSAAFTVGTSVGTSTLACRNQKGATNARLFATGGDSGHLRVNGTDVIANGDYDEVKKETVGNTTRWTYQKLQPDSSENVLLYERTAGTSGGETTTYYAEALAGSSTFIECGNSIHHQLGTPNTQTDLICRTNYRTSTYNSATRTYTYSYTYTAWRHARTGYYGNDGATGRYNSSTDTLSTSAYTSYYSSREWTLINVDDDNSNVRTLTSGWRRYADATTPRNLTIEYNIDGRVRWIADRINATNWTYCKPFIAR